MKPFVFTVFSPFVFLLLLAGCNTRSPLNVHFTPAGSGPVSSIKPLTVFIQVEDQRPPAEQDAVFQIVADVGGTDSWYTKTPVPLILREALISELSKAGHRPVIDPSDVAGPRVKIQLKRFRAFVSTSLLTVSIEAQVEAEVSVADEAKKSSVPPFHISGNYMRKSGVRISHQVGASNAEDALSAALADFIHNLTFDSRFVEGLQ
jgi:uncharacterized lipoprotein YajG